jgi:hypothetical protein
VVGQFRAANAAQQLRAATNQAFRLTDEKHTDFGSLQAMLDSAVI